MQLRPKSTLLILGKLIDESTVPFTRFLLPIEKNQFKLLRGKSANLDPENLWFIQLLIELMQIAEQTHALLEYFFNICIVNIFTANVALEAKYS